MGVATAGEVNRLLQALLADVYREGLVVSTEHANAPSQTAALFEHDRFTVVSEQHIRYADGRAGAQDAHGPPLYGLGPEDGIVGLHQQATSWPMLCR